VNAFRAKGAQKQVVSRVSAAAEPGKLVPVLDKL
jgi:hypothetical protein